MATAATLPHARNYKRTTHAKMLPGSVPGAWSQPNSVRCDLDEARELEFPVGDFRRPHADLLAILPLQHQAGDQALAVFEAVGEFIVLAVELDTADGAFPVGLFQRIDHLVGVGRSGTFDGVGDVVDLVI